MPTRHTAPITANFGGALKRLRSARGVTQEDLLTATSRRHVGRIEQGHQTPSMRAIESLARTLEIHPLTLVAAAYCQELDGKLIARLMRTVEEDVAKLISASGSPGGVPTPLESSESVP